MAGYYFDFVPKNQISTSYTQWGEVIGTGAKVAEMDAGLPQTDACYIYHTPWYCAKSLYMHQQFYLCTTSLGWCYIILILKMRQIGGCKG